MNFQHLAERCFIKENDQIYFMPYGALGRKIKLNEPLKQAMKIRIVRFYKLGMYVSVIGLPFIGIYILLAIPLMWIYYSFSVKKIEQKIPPELRSVELQCKPKTWRDRLRAIGIPSTREDFKKVESFAKENLRSQQWLDWFSLTDIILFFFFSMLMASTCIFLIVKKIEFFYSGIMLVFSIAIITLSVFLFRAYWLKKRQL